MKLAVFIPAYNEASTIGGVISAIPGKINGISQIRIFVVDDGSTDGTEEVAGSALASRESLLARAAGAPREDRSGHPTFEVAPTSKVGCVSIKPNRGLANAFRTGLATARNSGADLIVHLDADGQYDPAEIPKLLAPIMNNAVAGDHIGGSFYDWLYDAADFRRVVLPVRVQVGDYVGAPVQSHGKSGVKRISKPSVGGYFNYAGAGGARCMNGAVFGSVINHKNPVFADAPKVPWNGGNHRANRVLLVIRRNEDGQFHAVIVAGAGAVVEAQIGLESSVLRSYNSYITKVT